jgi:hypothetical protein
MSSPANASAPPPAAAAAAVGSAPKKDEEQLSFGEIMRKASASAVRGGTAGAVAMGANVFALMWMRTTVRFGCCGRGPCARRSSGRLLTRFGIFLSFFVRKYFSLRWAHSFILCLFVIAFLLPGQLPVPERDDVPRRPPDLVRRRGHSSLLPGPPPGAGAGTFKSVRRHGRQHGGPHLGEPH